MPFAFALAALSGVLSIVPLPGFDVPYLGWGALVPLLTALFLVPSHRRKPVALVWGLIFSAGGHYWYPAYMPEWLGFALIVAVGFYYAEVLRLGLWLTERLPRDLALLALPVSWAAIEFVKYIAPVVRDWWFVSLSASQWRFPPALQVLPVTGFPGLTALVMLVNLALAALIVNRVRGKVLMPDKHAFAALICAGLLLGFGAARLPAPENTFRVAVLTDMVNQDPEIRALGETDSNATPIATDAILAVDAALTRAAKGADFVVWPENEFAMAGDSQAPWTYLQCTTQSQVTSIL